MIEIVIRKNDEELNYPPPKSVDDVSRAKTDDIVIGDVRAVNVPSVGDLMSVFHEKLEKKPTNLRVIDIKRTYIIPKERKNTYEHITIITKETDEY
jgi:hypothetical protein